MFEMMMCLCIPKYRKSSGKAVGLYFIDVMLDVRENCKAAHSTAKAESHSQS